MDIDESFQLIGGFGSRQKCIVFLLATVANFLSVTQNVGMAILGSEPKFFCHDANGNSLGRGCGSQISENCVPCANCKDIVFQDNFTSVVSEWSLVCSSAYKSGALQSLYMVGVLIGTIVFGKMSDKFGRVPAIFASAGLMVVSACISSFSSSYEMFASTKFVCGFCNGGYGMIVTVYLSEIVGSDFRAFTVTLTNVMFAIGIMIMAVIAYYVRAWKSLVACLSYPFVLGVVFYWLLHESPRWLYSKGRVTEAEAVLNDMGRRNCGKTFDIKLKLGPSRLKRYDTSERSFIDLFTHPVMRLRTVLLCIVWFVNSFVYYGLTLGAGSMGNNRYIAVAMSGFVELPVMVVTVPLMNHVGRRSVLSGAMILAGIGCFIIVLLPPGAYGSKTVLSLVGKMFISSSFNSVFIHSSELTPTEVRAIGISVYNMGGRLGGILAPMVSSLDMFYPSLQFGVYGMLALVGGLLNFKQPETRGKPMPETFNDLDPSPVFKYQS